MDNQGELLQQVFESGTRLRENRRAFLRVAGGGAAAVAGGAFLASCGGGGGGSGGSTGATPTPTPSASATTAFTDADILNFALNLEYLEAEFYLYATTGSGLPANMRTGTGQQGLVTPGRQVTFTDPVVAQYAREIAADEMAHVNFLRTALGSSAVAEPNIDISFSPGGAFSSAARAAGLIGQNQAFDPYASDEAFLIGAFIFEDVGVTAYKGAAPLLTRTYIEAAAGILAAEAYHAGLVRTVLFRKGITVGANGATSNSATMIGNANIIDATEAISKLRDDADNSIDDDQGIRPSGNGLTGTSNIVPTDSNGIAFSRTAADVLNIVYLNQIQVSAGGFFPGGVNGRINTSSAFA